LYLIFIEFSVNELKSLVWIEFIGTDSVCKL